MLAIGLGLLALMSVTEASPRKPNILFLFADDLGWGDLGCYGSERIKTPALDSLAAEGTLFTQFYAPASVCSPSRAGIMTGQYPARHRIFAHFTRDPATNQERGMPQALDPDIYTLTDLMKEQGYMTGHFGKWHLGATPAEAYGLDVYITNDHTNQGDGQPIEIMRPEVRPTITKEILDDALDFIEANRDRPFYANIWFSDTHATLNPSDEQLAEIPRRFHAPPNTRFSGVDHVYLAALNEMDRQIGRFLERLDKLGLAESTLIIFSSDNGPEDYQIGNATHSGVGSAGPFRGRKRSIYEGGIRTPFILRWPGHVPAGKVNDASVIGGVDFLPTIAALVGADLPAHHHLDGENMVDVWTGSNRKRTTTLHWEWRQRIFGHMLNRSPMIAVREGDFKLLMNPDRSRLQLYDIVRDPAELQNLAATHPEVAERLAREALRWYATLPAGPTHPEAGIHQWRWPGTE